jgi:hypothetical protein
MNPFSEAFDWKAVAEHYKALFERHMSESNSKGDLLYNAYRTMAGQSRGLQRQARLIKRLRREIERLKQGNS